MDNITFHFYITPIKWNEYQALRYDQGRKNLAQSFKSVLTPHPSLGGDTGRFVANTKTGIVTFDKNGAIVPYVPHQGGKNTRRKANKKPPTTVGISVS